jgi:hypothetical protein
VYYILHRTRTQSGRKDAEKEVARAILNASMVLDRTLDAKRYIMLANGHGYL